MSVSNQLKYWYVSHDIPVMESIKPPEKVSSSKRESAEQSEEVPSIKEKIAEKRQKTAEEILTEFDESLQKKALHMSMRKAEVGCNGFTFICSARDGEELRHFILKWASEIETKNQKLCSDLFTHTDLSAPAIQVITGTLSHKLKQHAEGICPDFRQDNLTLIYMPAFPATTFGSAWKSGYLTETTTRAKWRKIFVQSGRALVMDLVIGNADRLFYTNWKNEGGDWVPHLNSGNLMVEMPHRKSLKGRILKGVHFIDNGTDPQLLKCFQQSEELDNSSSDSEEEGPSLDSWERTVREMTSHPDPLIEIAALGFKHFFKRAELRISPEKIKLFLKRGFKLQIKSIKALDLSKTERALQSTGLTGDVHTSTAQQIMKNLEIVQGGAK